jgi:hypothetical protein
VSLSGGGSVDGDVDGFSVADLGFSVGVKGALNGTIKVGPSDLNHDGKTRLNEIKALDQFFHTSAKLHYDISLYAHVHTPWPFPDIDWEHSLASGDFTLG